MSLALQASRAWKAYNVANALTHAALARRMLPVTLLEVGARGGLQRRWRLLERLHWVKPFFVEADASEAVTLQRRYGNDAVLAVAAGSEVGLATLFITREPGRSSVLSPDAEAIARFIGAGVPLSLQPYEIVETLPVTLEPLDAHFVGTDHVIDFIKTDVQGFDLAVLKGLDKTLANVASLMCEVQLLAIYRNQPSFTDVVGWLCERGFRLIAFRSFGDDIFEGNAHFENRGLNSERGRFLRTFWRKLYGIAPAEVNHSLAH
jgi:FkbM family methyltransferase